MSRHRQHTESGATLDPDGPQEIEASGSRNLRGSYGLILNNKEPGIDRDKSEGAAHGVGNKAKETLRSGKETLGSARDSLGSAAGDFKSKARGRTDEATRGPAAEPTTRREGLPMMGSKRPASGFASSLCWPSVLLREWAGSWAGPAS